MDKQALIAGLVPVDDETARNACRIGTCVPVAYVRFLVTFGSGRIGPPGEPDHFPAHFEVLDRLRSAEHEYFQDKAIYEHGARGDVLIFGFESNGICYGFDSGDNNAVVQIDHYRIVRKLALNFEGLIFGIIACFPDFPEKFANGLWTNDLGEKFSIVGKI